MVPYQDINSQSPFTSAFNTRGAAWMGIIVGFGSVCGILDTIVVTQYSMSRTFVILGRMGLVPPVLVSRPAADPEPGLSLMAGSIDVNVGSCVLC